MSTAVDLVALAAQGELKIPMARGVVSQGGSGTDYTGWSGVSSVFVEAKVEVREQSRGFATLSLTVEGSSNGSDWSTLETFTFGHGGSQSATVSSPPDHLRVSWAVGGHSEWQIIEVTAAPSVIDFTTDGGSQPQTLSYDATTDANTFLSPVHVFDLGDGAHSALVTITGIALVGDGETFGNDPGTLFATVAADDVFPGIQTNADGGNHYKAVTGTQDVSNFIVDAAGFVFELQASDQVADRICIAARYLRVQLGVFANDTGALYAGANHPTAHATISVTY